MARNTQQVGRCGELLVQYKLLKHGVDSAPMTTDAGIDLVAYAHISRKSLTIQVKTSTHRGRFISKWVAWNVKGHLAADYIALVDLDRDKAWFLAKDEFESRAGAPGGQDYSLWWYVPGHKRRKTTRTPKYSEDDFAPYEIDVVFSILF